MILTFGDDFDIFQIIYNQKFRRISLDEEDKIEPRLIVQ